MGEIISGSVDVISLENEERTAKGALVIHGRHSWMAVGGECSDIILGVNVDVDLVIEEDGLIGD